MWFKIFSLTCLVLTKFFIQPTTCALPNVQNLELDDVTSLWDKFPFLIDKIKEAVSRFRCPKGWKRLGGSCYYFSNTTSISSHVNYTCNYLHSNLSNLMQIRNAVDLFYAAHVLSRNNLSALMIDVDSSLLKGKQISEILINDQDRWKRMKEAFREVRIKYKKLKQKIVDRLTSTGLRILRRTKKMKRIPFKEDYNSDEIDFDEYEYYDRKSNLTFSNNTTININSTIDDDEYEYDDLDSSDEIDEFEQIENTRGICDEIHWNVLNNTNNSTVYILTKYNMSDKIICSLSDIELHTKYYYVCEYVLDFCFANVLCGKYGHCVNTLTGFKCSCSFLFGGLLCEKISEHGYQIVIGIILILIMLGLSFKIVRTILWFIVKLFIGACQKLCKKRKPKDVTAKNDAEHLAAEDRPESNDTITGTLHPQERRQTIVEEIVEEIIEFFSPRTSNPLLSPIKRNLVRNIWVGVLSIVFLSFLFVITTIMYYLSYGYNLLNDEEDSSINDTIHLVTKCAHISDYRRGNLVFAPFACTLILLFSWSIKREYYCKDMCEGRPGLIPPIEPFRTGNRFTTATVFGILAFEVLKIFEELLFSTGQPLAHGVLVELLQRIALIIVVGLRYYPVLASLQLRNIVARFFACLYIICNIIYTIIREGTCMGFLPLSGQYTVFEEAKLRRDLGTWFIIYGLIKNIPHFFFLSYICAELCVRFGYDSIYVPKKKNESIWLAPIVQLDESEFAKYYVTKLFRRNRRRSLINIQHNTNIDNLIDYENEVEQQNKADKSRFKKLLKYFYHFDDDFRFTTMAMCTYTVAVVFLYYLACTFVFLYITRTTGHIYFLKFYFESTFNVDLGAFSFQKEIIISAILTGIIYAGQLFIGMQNYKKHKLQLYKGIYVDIPSAANFELSSIASHSVHYSGFLVGYMAWGFVICFHLVLVILIGIRIVYLQLRRFEIVLSIIVPILVIYSLKLLSMASAGKFLFIRKKEDKLNLSCRKTYAIFVYFSFLADCFLGIASCIIRLIQATFLNVIFMARLDWSFLGRPLEKFDRGFATYVSYLHMEVAYTNPVMLAFCYSLYDDIVQRRPKHCYADECCIAPGEFDSENVIEIPRQRQVQQNKTNLSQNVPTDIYRRTDNHDGSTEDDGKPNIDESISKRTSQIEIKRRSQEFPTTKIVFETESPKLTTISTKENQKNITKKMQQQQSNIANEGQHSSTLTIDRHIPQQQQPLLGPAPKIPRREDLSSEQDETDDDGTWKPDSFSTIEKPIPKPQPSLKLPVKSSKINTDNRTDEGEDGSVSKQNESIKKKNSKKRKKNISKSKILKPYDTIEMITLSTQPTLDNRKAQHESSSDNTDDTIEHKENVNLISVDTVAQKALKKSDTNRNTKPKKTKDKNPYETVLTEEERATQETTYYSPPSSNVPTNSTDSYHLQTILYCEDPHSTPPIIPHRSHSSSIPRNQNNTNDDSSHYSEITNATIRSGISNPSYSKVGLIEPSSSHLNKQQIFEEQKQDDDTNVETEEEEEEKVHLLKSQPTSLPNESIATSRMDASNELDEKEEIQRIKRRKRLRFRWYFLYTMINNYHLFDLRKHVQSRLACLHLQRSNLINEQQFATATTMMEVPETIELVAESGVEKAKARGMFEPFEADMPTPFEQKRPPPPARLLSVPVSISNDYPSSPAERYIAIRAQMIYDSNAQQPNTPNASCVLRTPTTVPAYMQQIRPQMTTSFSDQSLGFPVSPDIIVHPPSERSMKSGGKQTTVSSISRVLQQEMFTPSQFQPASASNQSTAGYPLAESSTVNPSTYRTQMSHDQHMQKWRYEQLEKIQKKQRHGYVYGVSPQPAMVDKVSDATILTPQVLSTTTKQQQVPPTPNTGQIPRQPTKSPFPFSLQPSQARSAPSSTTSDSQSKNKKKQKLKKNTPQQGAPIPPQRMERLDEDPQETSNANQTSIRTSALIHRKDSQSSTTDITEV